MNDRPETQDKSVDSLASRLWDLAFLFLKFRPRKSPWMAAFLDAVNVCAVALMVGVTFRLGIDALHGWPSWVIALISLVVLVRWKINPAWVVLPGELRDSS